jgi:hypothetical protein
MIRKFPTIAILLMAALLMPSGFFSGGSSIRRDEAVS